MLVLTKEPTPGMTIAAAKAESFVCDYNSAKFHLDQSSRATGTRRCQPDGRARGDRRSLWTDGGGKYTLLDVMIGLLLPDCGSVSVDGRPRELAPTWWWAQLGMVLHYVS